MRCPIFSSNPNPSHEVWHHANKPTIALILRCSGFTCYGILKLIGVSSYNRSKIGIFFFCASMSQTNSRTRFGDSFKEFYSNIGRLCTQHIPCFWSCFKQNRSVFIFNSSDHNGFYINPLVGKSTIGSNHFINTQIGSPQCN